MSYSPVSSSIKSVNITPGKKYNVKINNYSTQGTEYNEANEVDYSEDLIKYFNFLNPDLVQHVGSFETQYTDNFISVVTLLNDYSISVSEQQPTVTTDDFSNLDIPLDNIDLTWQDEQYYISINKAIHLRLGDDPDADALANNAVILAIAFLNEINLPKDPKERRNILQELKVILINYAVQNKEVLSQVDLSSADSTDFLANFKETETETLLNSGESLLKRALNSFVYHILEYVPNLSEEYGALVISIILDSSLGKNINNFKALFKSLGTTALKKVGMKVTSAKAKSVVDDFLSYKIRRLEKIQIQKNELSLFLQKRLSIEKSFSNAEKWINELDQITIEGTQAATSRYARFVLKNSGTTEEIIEEALLAKDFKYTAASNVSSGIVFFIFSEGISFARGMYNSDEHTIRDKAVDGFKAMEDDLGKNAALATGAFVGEVVGSLTGAFLGNLIGGPIGAVIGKKIGVFFGGLIGSFIGETVYNIMATDSQVKEEENNLNKITNDLSETMNEEIEELEISPDEINDAVNKASEDLQEETEINDQEVPSLVEPKTVDIKKINENNLIYE